MTDRSLEGWEENFRLAFKSRYLGAHHFRGHDVTLTISAVSMPEIEVMEQGSKTTKKENRMIIRFDSLKGKGCPIEWLVNVTNAATIAKLWGKAPRHWVGKAITLYALPGKWFGEERDAIRVRPTRPVARGTARQEEVPPPSPAVSDEEAREILEREREGA